MNKIILMIVIFAVTVMAGFVSAEDALFITAVGGTDIDKGYSVAQTSDGGYVVTGFTQSYGSGDYDVLLVKFDSSGSEEWTKTVGGALNDYGYSVVQTSDSGYIVAGSSHNYGGTDSDVLLVKFDSSGAKQWTRTVGGTLNDYGYSVAQTSDGGYVVTGKTLSYGAGNYDVLLVKFNSSGAKQWTRTVGGAGVDVGYSVAHTSDGGYVVTGYTPRYGGADSDVLLVKFDSSGTEQWNKTVGGTDGDYGLSVAQTSDSGYIVTGNTASYGNGNRDVLLVKFNSSGEEEWTRTVGGTYGDYGYSVVHTSDGGYVVTGFTLSYGTGDYEVLLVKFDSSGVEQWTKTVGNTSKDYGYSVAQTSDGGYVVTGQSASYGEGNYDVLLIRVDANGECGTCSALANEDDVIVGSPAVTVGSPEITVGSPAVTVGSPAVTVGSPNPNESQVCYELISSTTPIYSNFTSEETTNFSEVTLASVTSMTLAIDNKGKIAFPSDHSINTENEDYDKHIKIEDGFISVNTSALDSSFNSSSILTIEGVTCPVATISYAEGFFSTKDDIIANGRNCIIDGVCSNVQCAGTTLTFDVSHFTGFAAGSNSNLTIEAEAGIKYPLDSIEFTAEYVNSTDGTPISGECNITFDDEGTWHTMDFNSPDYNYTKSFAVAGTHEYNVTCSSANFVTLEANDTKLVSSVDIPEFSVLTLGLGLIAVLIGLAVIRKKK